jgi:hypothetical protein
VAAVVLVFGVVAVVVLVIGVVAAVVLVVVVAAVVVLVVVVVVSSFNFVGAFVGFTGSSKKFSHSN